MKKYIINGFSSKEAYIEFIRYAISKSDFFSLVYIRYSEEERMKKCIKVIHDALKKHKVCVKRGGRWPENFVHPDDKFIYKVVLYKAVPEVLPYLVQPESLSAWQHPNFPEDLCFYKNDLCWLAWTSLYADDEEAALIKAMGVDLNYEEETDALFSLEDLGKPVTKEELKRLEYEAKRRLEEQTGVTFGE